MRNERQVLSSMTKVIAVAEIVNGKVQVWTFAFIIMDGRGVGLKGASLSGFVDPGPHAARYGPPKYKRKEQARPPQTVRRYYLILGSTHANKYFKSFPRRILRVQEIPYQP
jgi:hypothetical protein